MKRAALMALVLVGLTGCETIGHTKDRKDMASLIPSICGKDDCGKSASWQ